ncbi:MAG: DUF2877 domain-containing protein [Candidatus Eremiobacterota bacterium]
MYIDAISIDKRLMDLLISCEIECIIHSIFRRAINLKTSGCDMISIISGGNGPNVIMVSDRYDFLTFGLNTGHSVTCTENGIYFHKEIFINFKNIPLWEYLPGKINTDKLKKNFFSFLSFLASKKYSDPEEIIKETFLSVQNPSIAVPLYDSINSLIKAIKEHNRGRIKSFLSRIIGTGEGLTPAGDDFLVGLVGILYYFSRTAETSERASFILDIIKEELDTEKTNFISSRFLSFSLEGRFSQTVLEFLDALFSASPVDQKPLRNLLSYGASSGTVTVTGILTGCLLLT